MALQVYTSIVGRYTGADALDITHKSATGPGIVFAPSTRLLRRYHPRWGGTFVWNSYLSEYIKELESRVALDRTSVDQVLALKTVTLLCYCKDVKVCHRIAAAHWLVEYGGAVYLGERDLERKPRRKRAKAATMDLFK